MRHRLLSSALLLLAALPAWAAEEGHGAHGEHHGIPWSTLFFTAVNFGLFVLLIWRAVLPALRTWALDRRNRIVDELQKAANARAEAEELKNEWRRRMERLDQELAEIRNQALADAQRERERILQLAGETAKAIAADAEKAVGQEVQRAREELRGEVARQALALAGEIVRQRLDQDDQKRFIDEFLREVHP
jgi:F-type H+-transporting ATPase subunit b